MTVARATPRLEVDLEVEVTAEAVVRIHAIGHATKTSVEPTVIMAARSGAMTTVPARTKKILLLLI
jgi:hypothetical protein